MRGRRIPQSVFYQSPARGQQQSTTLPDGSHIIPNSNSQIRVDYGEHYRLSR